MAVVTKAPNQWIPDKFTIFLAGSIDMGRARDWQSIVCDELADYDVNILSPRREDWDSSWEQSADNPQFREQVEWEQDGLDRADFRIFNFEKDSKAPITFEELGAHLDDRGAVVCPEGFYRKGNVDIVSERAGMPVFEALDDMLAYLKNCLGKLGLKNRNRSTTASVKQSAKESLKEWFVGSKIVDASGKPLLVYHGSSEDFNVFQSGRTIHFTDRETVAAQYAQGYLRTGTGHIYSAYLHISDPIDLRKPGETARVFEETEVLVDEETILDPETLIQELDDTPYDGIIAFHESGGGVRDGGVEYIVFDPLQIWIAGKDKREGKKASPSKTSATVKTAKTVGPVYHGTTYDFDEFKRNKGLRSGFLGSVTEVDVQAFFFTESKQQAIAYAKNRQKATKGPIRLITAYLTMNNMLDLTNPNWVNVKITHPPLPLHKTLENDPYESHADDLDSADGLLDYLVNYLLEDEMSSEEWDELGVDDGRHYSRIGKPELNENFHAWELFDNQKVSEALRFCGFDGAKVPEGNDTEFGGTSFCVFSSSQVRVASNVEVEKAPSPKAAASPAHTPGSTAKFAGAHPKIASAEELESLKFYLTMSDRDKGEELARSFPQAFKDFIDQEHEELSEHIPEDEDDFLDDFDKFPPDVLEQFLEEYGSQAINDAPAYAPSFLSMRYEGDVTNGWLVHFTDHPYDIVQSGFRYGIDDVRHLALTTYFKDSAKERGGYNFAFSEDDVARYGESGHYGTHAVLFQANGVKVYHFGDEERQVIFWGADAHDIFPIDYDLGEWVLHHPQTRNELFRTEDIDEMVEWIKANQNRYHGEDHSDEIAQLREDIEEIDEILDDPRDDDDPTEIERLKKEKAEKEQRIAELEAGHPQQLKHVASVETCTCGHPATDHIHPPDFGCVHENDGCGCVGFTTAGKTAAATDTQAFKAWFKNSKIVDAEGKPLRMYHGTRTSFDEFDDAHSNPDAMFGKGFYFTADPEISSGNGHYTNLEDIQNAASWNLAGYSWQGSSWEIPELSSKQMQKARQVLTSLRVQREEARDIGTREVYAAGKKAWNAGEPEFRKWLANQAPIETRLQILGMTLQQINKLKGIRKADPRLLATRPQTVPVYLSIQKPFDMEGSVPEVEAKRIFAGTVFDPSSLYANGQPVKGAELWEAARRTIKDRNEVNAALKHAGYDGITHIGGRTVGNKEHRVAIAFYPNQIKSAIGNKGTFDPSNNSVVAAVEDLVTPPTESTAFRSWFDQSKVVDADGNPLIVHHKTHNDFDEFDRQWAARRFKRDPEGTDTVGSWFTENPDVQYGSKNMDVYLSIRKPLVLWDEPNKGCLDQLIEMVQYEGGATKLRAVLKSYGYDGIKFEDTDLDWNRQNVWIAFEPNQIKSADKNNGQFDPKSNKITASWLSPSEQLEERLTAFLHDLWDHTTVNPENEKEVVWKNAIGIEAKRFHGRIHLSAIRSLAEGQGKATAALEFLKKLADVHQVELEVVPVPFGGRRLNQAQLREWYVRHGFKKAPEGVYYVYSPAPSPKTAADVPAPVTNTPAFKAWFRNSVVKDDQGNPLVVYRGEHGDSNTEFHSREGALSFGSADVAKAYAQHPNNRNDKVVRPRVYPCYLRIEKPFINDKEDPFIDLSVVADVLGQDAAIQCALKYDHYIYNTNNWEENFSVDYSTVKDLLEDNPEAVRELYLELYILLADHGFVEKLKAKGFDGAIHGGSGESAMEAEYKVFDPSQAKSAISFQVDKAASKTAFEANSSLIDWRYPQDGLTVSFQDLLNADMRSGEKLHEYAKTHYRDSQIFDSKRVKVWWVRPTRFQYEVNVRWSRQDEAQVAELVEKMKLGERFVPALFDDGQWLDGNHRIRAAAAAGFDKVPCVYLRDFLHADKESSAERYMAYRDDKDAAIERRNKEDMERILRELSEFDESDPSKRASVFPHLSSVALPHPGVLYHVAPAKYRSRIEKQGLLVKPFKRKTLWERMHNNAGVYLCVSPTAFEAGGIWSQDLNYFDIWKVDVDGLFVRKDEAGGMEDSYYVDEDIPPSRIELYRAATNHPSMQNSVVAHLSTTPSQSINVRI